MPTIAPAQAARVNDASRLRRLLVAVLASVAVFAPRPAAAGEDDIKVKVERRGELVVTDIELQLEATLDEVWAVLTDYEHMPSFISTLKTSKVTKRSGDSLEVAQSGEKTVMFMRFAFKGVRGIELHPKREIRTRLIEGDFKSYDSSTRLSEGGGKVHLVQHGEYVPKKWVPPMIGPALIESESRRHYREIVAEVLRRRSQAAPR